MKTICSNCEAENEINSKYCSVCGYKLPLLENQNAKTEIEEAKITKPKRKFDLKTFLGFIAGFIIMFFVTQSFFKPSIDKQLAEMANEINKTCPMNIDEYTTLKNVVALPNKTVQYNYILVGITKAEVKLDTVKRYVFPGVLQNVKTNPAMKFFRENKVTLNYYYSDKNGEYVTEYIVKPEMYE
ncbi:zinc-ribbon domain-containing protein [Flavobacterium sp. GB2R13]|uniref:zinc-ribbon domain-containing protein n=1 Tax=Flavobacterium algoris TaxID=3398733 RepID=UPI003A87B092